MCFKFVKNWICNNQTHNADFHPSPSCCEKKQVMQTSSIAQKCPKWSQMLRCSGTALKGKIGKSQKMENKWILDQNYRSDLDWKWEIP